MSCSLLSGWRSVQLVGAQEDTLLGSATAQMENKRQRNHTGQPQDWRMLAPEYGQPAWPPVRPSVQITPGGRAAGPERQLPCTRLPCEDVSPTVSQPREPQLTASDF